MAINDLCFSLSINFPTSLTSFAWYLLLLCSYRNRENVYDLFYLQWLLLFVFRAASRLVGNFLDTVRLLREAEPSLNSSSEDVTFPPKDMDMSIEFIKSSCVWSFLRLMAYSSHCVGSSFIRLKWLPWQLVLKTSFSSHWPSSSDEESILARTR